MIARPTWSTGNVLRMRDCTALYLYGVVQSTGRLGGPLVITTPGLDGEEVRVVAHREVGVLTHSCAPEPCQGNDEQVHAWVLAQHAVVSAAHHAAGTILPIRFNSIVAADGGRSATELLVDWLDRCHDALAARLAALRDRVELGVQVLAAGPQSDESSSGRSAARDVSGSSSRGRAYFQNQLAQRQDRERLRAAEALTVQTVFDDLAARADEIIVNPPRPVRDGDTGTGPAQRRARMLVDVSVLVRHDAVGEIGQYLAGVEATPGVTVRFTGPWPPYGFTGAFDMPLLVSVTDVSVTDVSATDVGDKGVDDDV